MNAIFKGVRPFDYVLAALATGAGVFLMLENMTTNGHGLAHPLSTTTGPADHGGRVRPRDGSGAGPGAAGID